MVVQTLHLQRITLILPVIFLGDQKKISRKKPRASLKELC